MLKGFTPSNINLLVIFCSILLVYSTIVSTTNLFNKSSIGYINSAKLIEKYPAAIKAKTDLEKKTAEWKKNIQTLEEELNMLNQEMIKNGSTWSKQVLHEREEIMKQKQADYNRYARAISEKASQAENEIFQPVYSELNNKIEDFGKDKGYHIILGTLSGGNILYADDSKDLTDEFLKYVQKKQ